MGEGSLGMRIQRPDIEGGIPNGNVITSHEVMASEALAEIGEALRESGYSLEDMIERGHAIRGRLLHDLYGIDNADVENLPPTRRQD